MSSDIAPAAIVSLISAVALAYFHHWIADWSEFILVGTTMFFIIPLGALMLGFGGAIGFYVAVKNATHLEPGGLFMLCAAAFGLFSLYLTYLIMYYYSPYYDLDVGFWPYLASVAHSKGIFFVGHHEGHIYSAHHVGEVEDIGFLGWVSLIVQPIGAALGGVAAALTPAS